MSPEEMERRIKDAVASERADGFQLVAGTFGCGKAGCALTAVFRHEVGHTEDKGKDIAHWAEVTFGRQEASYFTLGFDRISIEPECEASPYYLMGRRLRRELMEDQDES